MLPCQLSQKDETGQKLPHGQHFTIKILLKKVLTLKIHFINRNKGALNRGLEV